MGSELEVEILSSIINIKIKNKLSFLDNVYLFSLFITVIGYLFHLIIHEIGHFIIDLFIFNNIGNFSFVFKDFTLIFNYNTVNQHLLIYFGGLISTLLILIIAFRSGNNLYFKIIGIIGCCAEYYYMFYSLIDRKGDYYNIVRILQIDTVLFFFIMIYIVILLIILLQLGDFKK